eukprot:TRINITY_DN3000_c0_g1_i2.p1 TRINITY_DN3000_c0_g1~~TRINITY_DN3000_c0_g1_i2.p1  ORF type:complete len:306 (+),score=101.04 TRINITY_DN3000_c0_g1_i2:546-1463(+)
MLLVEYVDFDGVEGFDSTLDAVASVVDITDVEWKPLKLTRGTSSDGANYYLVSGETKSEIFGFRFAIADSDLNIGSNHVAAQSSKIDLWIRYFNQTANPFGFSDNRRSQLALIATLDIATKSLNADFSYHGNNGNKGAVNGYSADCNGTRVGFSWSLDAQTNNGFIRVVSEEHQNFTITFGGRTWTIKYSNSSTTQVLYYSFLDTRPAFIYWDPVVGAQSFSPQVVPETKPSVITSQTSDQEQPSEKNEASSEQGQNSEQVSQQSESPIATENASAAGTNGLHVSSSSILTNSIAFVFFVALALF